CSSSSPPRRPPTPCSSWPDPPGRGTPRPYGSSPLAGEVGSAGGSPQHLVGPPPRRLDLLLRQRAQRCPHVVVDGHAAAAQDRLGGRDQRLVGDRGAKLSDRRRTR